MGGAHARRAYIRARSYDLLWCWLFSGMRKAVAGKAAGVSGERGSLK